MKINVYYSNNGVGIVSDNILIKSVLKDYDVISYIKDKINEHRKSDVGIHIQDFDIGLLSNNKVNILIINEEWYPTSQLNVIQYVDFIFVKSLYAKSLLDLYHKNVICTGFFSLDRHFFPTQTNKILHFKGKSIQKNTELVLNYKFVKVLNSEETYLSENEVLHELNNNDIHICCSLYEAWGHYLWEAMSCGKLVICSEIPVFKEYLNPDLVKFVSIQKEETFVINHRFLNNNLFKFRKGYFVNKSKIDELLNEKEYLFEFQKNKRWDIRQHFLDVNVTNKNKFLNTIKAIL
jgi:hypothetical protein